MEEKLVLLEGVTISRRSKELNYIIFFSITFSSVKKDKQHQC